MARLSSMLTSITYIMELLHQLVNIHHIMNRARIISCSV